ncbi:Protein FAR-RED IMPAIRED RESPONSE 1, partial [Linum perenne]
MYEGILSDLQNLMYNVDDEATFDRYWKLTIEKHFPGKGEFGHPWLQFIHKFRQQWSSAWVNNHFTCGMRSSQLSETLNSNLRKFLDTKCNLHQFFTQFNRLLQGKRADELQMDYHSKIAQAPSRYIKHPHIEQASKFDEDNQTHLDERRVIVNPATADYKCSCRLFDSHGWLCRHILKTMDHVMLWENKDARTIPSKYLKVRWRKTAKVGVDFVIQFGGETDPDSEVSRYHELMS